jgi:hypothetical protein
MQSFHTVKQWHSLEHTLCHGIKRRQNKKRKELTLTREKRRKTLTT